MTAVDFADRALGAYLGLAVGDALGASVEFMTAGEIARQYGTHREIVGGGWLKLAAGQVTDDTQMSLALGAALLDADGWRLEAIAERWLIWLKSRPIDVGNTCRRGLTRYLRDGSLEAPYSDGDAGNGALMRNLPTVLYAFRDAALLERCSLAQARITHHHPFSDAATLCVARMLAATLQATDARENFRDNRAIAARLVEEHRQFRYRPYPGRASAYVVDTVQTVFDAFFETDDFESCLVRAVNRGGDADTNGAIAGMLAGARYGAAAIPARWLRRLDREVRREIERQAAALPLLGAPPRR